MSKVNYSPYCMWDDEIIRTPLMGVTGPSGYASSETKTVNSESSPDFFLDYYELLVPNGIKLNVDPSIGVVMRIGDHILQKYERERRVPHYTEDPGFDIVFEIVKKNSGLELTREDFMDEQIELLREGRTSFVTMDSCEIIPEVPKIIDPNNRMAHLAIVDHRNPGVADLLDKLEQTGIKIIGKHICDTHTTDEYFYK